MADIEQRIIDSAIRLADEGGFQAVRLRDVAAAAGIGLGTLYTRFRSKEAILVAALEGELEKFYIVLKQFPPRGETVLERMHEFFGLATQAFIARPNFARAVLRSVAVGDEKMSGRVIRYYSGMSKLIVTYMRAQHEPVDEPTPAEAEVAFFLQQAWFGILMGWMNHLYSEEEAVESMKRAATLLIRGYETTRAAT